VFCRELRCSHSTHETDRAQKKDTLHTVSWRHTHTSETTNALFLITRGVLRGAVTWGISRATTVRNPAVMRAAVPSKHRGKVRSSHGGLISPHCSRAPRPLEAQSRALAAAQPRRAWTPATHLHTMTPASHTARHTPRRQLGPQRRVARGAWSCALVRLLTARPYTRLSHSSLGRHTRRPSGRTPPPRRASLRRPCVRRRPPSLHCARRRAPSGSRPSC